MIWEWLLFFDQLSYVKYAAVVKVLYRKTDVAVVKGTV